MNYVRKNVFMDVLFFMIFSKGRRVMIFKISWNPILKAVGFLGFFLFLSSFFHVNGASAASYSPYDIEQKVYDQRWDTEGSNKYSSTSGKRLMYDIYEGKNGKEGYKIKTKNFGNGKKTYLTFTGWSAIVGYTHHTASNQSTYILALNKAEKKEKMYRVEQGTRGASKDLEYNRTSWSGKINNRCSNNTYNKVNNTCNMDYLSVGFRAWLPLEELFPNEDKSSEWELYLVKRVGTGSKMNVVYDRIITPFEFSGTNFQSGALSLSSGINAKKLNMLVTDAVRRSQPRGTDNGGHYFKKGNTYNTVTHSEAYTQIWYGVSSPEDGGKTRYAGSLYWKSQGDPAVLRYDVSGKTCPDGSTVKKGEKCTVKVTIKHVDIDTNQALKTETKKATVGEEYSYKPKATGAFVNPAGIDYKATPSGQKFTGKTPNSNMSFTFTYRAKGDSSSDTDNEKTELIKSGEKPRATGYFYWELRRENANAASKVYIDSKFSINSTHYAIRNAKLTVMGPNISKSDQAAISFSTVADKLKDEKLSYDYKYEYTNYYRNYYKKEWYWVNGDPGYWDFYWKFDRTEVAWDKGDTFSLDESVDEDLDVKVNHSQSEFYDLDEMSEVSDVSLVVGKRQNWENNVRTLNKTYYEKFSKANTSTAKSENSLHAQTYLQMEPDLVNYEVELPSGKQKTSDFKPLLKQGSSGGYFTNDMDESLQEHYKVKDSPEGSGESTETEETVSKFVTGQTSSYYEDNEGYTGTLSPYLYDSVKPAAEKKYVTNQLSVNYNDGQFKGTLSPYVYSGTYIPSSSKTVSNTSTGSFTCDWVSNSDEKVSWSAGGGWTEYLPSSVYYSEGGYSGTLYLGSTSHTSCETVKPSSPAPAGTHSNPSTTAYGNYSGTVVKPSSDTRVWRFQGTVTKESDVVQETRYQGYVTKTFTKELDSNEGYENLGDYKIPIQMKSLDRTSSNGDIAAFQMKFLTDYFFMSKDFGYVGFYPYAERMKEHLKTGAALPSSNEILNTVKTSTSKQFKEQTGESFDDTFLYTDSSDRTGLFGSAEKMQRYWIPIYADSSYENGQTYENEIVLENMGLSDVSFNFAQSFSFDLYLMGSVHDDVATWEQVEPRTDIDKYDYSVTLTGKQQEGIMKIKRNNYALHGFRITDTKRIYSDLKGILKVKFGDFW